MSLFSQKDFSKGTHDEQQLKSKTFCNKKSNYTFIFKE